MTTTHETTTELAADYVIVGSGAVGMAFADIIVTESDASVIIVDQYPKPGGHWNVAYPFVTLHQPASFYGVSSLELSGGRIEQGGLNNGLGELSSGAAVSAYFDDVMRHQFLPSGRVQYFPLHTYVGDGMFTSNITGAAFHATATRKFVDATYLKTSVPSTHTPSFSIDDGVRLCRSTTCRPSPNPPMVMSLSVPERPAWTRACGYSNTESTPTTSRGSSRETPGCSTAKNTQMTEPFFFDTLGAQAGLMESIAESTSPEDMFNRLEACGYLVRIDRSVEPQMFHGATASQAEIEALRQITNVVRLGHVTALHPDKIELVNGTIPTTPNTVHVDCSACAIPNLETKPIFDGDVITPQLVRPYQPVFSAAFIAHVELEYDTEDEKNHLCGVVALPNTLDDFVRFTASAFINQYNWSQDKALQRWIGNNRLDGASSLVRTMTKDDTDKRDVLRRIRENAPAATMKLLEYQAEATP